MLKDGNQEACTAHVAFGRATLRYNKNINDNNNNNNNNNDNDNDVIMMITIITIITMIMILSIAAHDELGTCRASLVCPEQSVLSIPIRSIDTTVLTVM